MMATLSVIARSLLVALLASALAGGPPISAAPAWDAP